jgi:HEPN domain-containing protein
MGNEKDSKKFRDFAIAFLREAKEDLDGAERLFEVKKYSRAVFLSQQAVEKSVKALLEMEKIFVAEHDLATFFVKFIYNNKSYKSLDKEKNIILENLNYFEGEWGKTRYPREMKGKVVIPTELYDEHDAIQAIEKAGETIKVIKYILQKKFRL